MNWPWWLQLLGLLLGFAGALLITMSQRPGHSISEGRASGEVPYVVLESPRAWTWGLRLLCGGFILQFAALLFMACA